MSKHYRHFLNTVFMILLSAIVLGACSKPVTPGISDEEIAAKVDNLLVGMNEGDYEKFSQDFSPKMIDAIGTPQFEDLRNMVQAASGTYVSLPEDGPAKQSKQGFAVYSYLCKYEHEEVKVTVSIASGGNQIEGLFFDSKNLRKNTSQ